MIPLYKLLVQWMFTFDFRIWSMISVLNFYVSWWLLHVCLYCLFLAISPDVKYLRQE